MIHLQRVEEVLGSFGVESVLFKFLVNLAERRFCIYLQGGEKVFFDSLSLRFLNLVGAVAKIMQKARRVLLSSRIL